MLIFIFLDLRHISSPSFLLKCNPSTQTGIDVGKVMGVVKSPEEVEDVAKFFDSRTHLPSTNVYRGKYLMWLIFCTSN